MDIIKNQSITATTLARTQQSDDYLATIRESLQQNLTEFPNFTLKSQLLYKTLYVKSLNITKYLLCIPDVLLPSVIHTIHTSLGIDGHVKR